MVLVRDRGRSRAAPRKLWPHRLNLDVGYRNLTRWNQRFFRLCSRPEIPAAALLALKQSAGADFIREHNLNTRLADDEFASGWLDAEDE